MPPQIATVIFAVGILGLFLLDRDRKSRVSPALWLPVAWVSIAASRTVAQWLGLAPIMVSPDQYVEGSPIDRLIFSALLAAGLMVLLARSRRVRTLLLANGPLLVFLVFLSYCALSILWSEYPFVAFKRWIRALGDPVMVLVVLTDANPSAAIKRLFARIGFLLIPLSILLLKYYPVFGRKYHRWTGDAFYNGVATSKNGLGFVCLIFGLASLWRFLEALHSGERTPRAGPLIAHGTILAMALWLFWMADSVTSFGCFLVGGALIAVTNLSGLARKPAAVHVLALGTVSLCLFALFFDPSARLAEAMGRESTLTGRTEFWAELLSMRENAWFGTGFRSFWLGERAKWLWENHWWRPTQAHNGYLEVFLNLGWLGVALLGLVIACGYRNVVGALHWDRELGGLRLAFFMVAVLYNLTEAAFRGPHIVWIVFFLAVTVVPKPSRPGDGIASHAKPSQVRRSVGSNQTKLVSFGVTPAPRVWTRQSASWATRGGQAILRDRRCEPLGTRKARRH